MGEAEGVIGVVAVVGAGETVADPVVRLESITSFVFVSKFVELFVAPLVTPFGVVGMPEPIVVVVITDV
jgi:hypothetical protein